MRKIICTAVSLFLVLPAICAQEKTALDHYSQAREAYEKKDYAAYLQNLQSAIKLAPAHPAIMYALARASALTGNRAEALKWLDRAANFAGDLKPDRDEAFASIRNTEEFKAILKKLEKLRSRAGASSLAFTIPERDLIPEGTAYDANTGALFIGSTYKRKIVRISPGGEIKDFVREKQDGIWGLVGMKVDAKRRHLWANNASASVMPIIDYNPSEEWRTAVFKYNVDTGRLIRKYIFPEPGHFFNDLTVSASGDVFITDTQAGAVYWIDHRKDSIEIFLDPGRFSFANGIDLSSDGRYLFVAHFSGVARVEIATRKIVALTHADDVTLVGIDGMYFYQGSLVAFQNGLDPERVMRFFLSPDLSRVERAKIIEMNNPYFNAPTTGAVAGDTLFYIANSQLDKFRDGKILPIDQLRDVFILRTKL